MKPFIRNWSYLVTADVITKFLGFFATILLARNLNPAGYGSFNVVLAVSAIFTVLANFGMTQIVTREVARNNKISGLFFIRVLVIRFFAIIFALVGIILYYKFFESSIDDLTIIFTCIITISVTAWDLFESFAFGRQVMKYSAIINISNSILWVSALYLLPKSQFTIINVLLIFSSLDLLKAIVYYIILRRKNFLEKIYIEQIPTHKDIIKMSLPYLWLWGLGIFSNQIPILFLNQNKGQEEVGYFSIGLRLLLPLSLVISTAMKAVFPNMSVIFKENKEKFRTILSDGIIIIVVLGSIVAFILSTTSDIFIPLLFSDKYINAILPFNFLIWYIVLYSVDVLLGTSLSASDRQLTLSILGTIDFIISIPILYYSSKYGAYELALAKLIIGFILISYHWIILKQMLQNKFNFLNWLYIILLLAVLFFISVFLKEAFLIKFLLFIFILVVFYYLPKTPFKRIFSIIKEYNFIK